MNADRSGISWTNTLFIASAHLVALVAIVYLAAVRFSWWTVGFAFVWLTLCSLAITGGYHRLFAHAAFRASRAVRALFLLFGAASVQNSALKWAADHRTHHARSDREEDPYSIRRGFWWAHIGWVLADDGQEPDYGRVLDLREDRLVALQDRFYLPLAILMGGLVPFALGFAWGDPVGALLCAGFLRLVLQWHATFSINSFAHLLGTQPYSKSGSARDSWITALLTLGEGYHNYHHRFQADYRNGHRWYQFDPTKWMIWLLSRLRLAWDLRRMPEAAIRRARERAAG